MFRPQDFQQMPPHITAVNHKVMQLVNLCSFNPCCDVFVLTSIDVGKRVFSHVLKPHES